MDARERWQALQSRLTAARTAFDAGDRGRALVEVDAALAIDPSFLAAADLRERITGGAVAGLRVPNAEKPLNLHNPEPAARNPLPGPPGPLPAGYIQFEQRALRRRADRRIAAAKQAIENRNLRGAAAALDEVIQIDPNQPELSELTAAFDTLRRECATSSRGPAIAATAAFVAVMFGATFLQHERILHSNPSSAIAALVDAPAPEPLDLSDAAILEPLIAESPAPEPLPVATSGRSEIVSASVVERRPLSPPTPSAPPFVPMPLPAPAAAAPLTVAPAAALPAATAAVDIPKVASTAPRVESDDAQIARVLQQYRVAYGALDASRARAIWPAVNEAALARAFDSLASQTLTFDACRTQLSGDAAVATCAGTARYVPKIGSRDPRVEPRTWTFILRRSAQGWMIDTARAER